jgi:hypothetical protein
MIDTVEWIVIVAIIFMFIIITWLWAESIPVSTNISYENIPSIGKSPGQIGTPIRDQVLYPALLNPKVVDQIILVSQHVLKNLPYDSRICFEGDASCIQQYQWTINAWQRVLSLAQMVRAGMEPDRIALGDLLTDPVFLEQLNVHKLIGQL